MREEEAKTKWCPFTRMVFGYKQGTTQPFNRFMCEDDKEVKKMQGAMNGTSGTKCIASGCMMWIETDNETIPSKSNEVRDFSNSPSYPAGRCGLSK